MFRKQFGRMLQLSLVEIFHVWVNLLNFTHKLCAALGIDRLLERNNGYLMPKNVTLLESRSDPQIVEPVT